MFERNGGMLSATFSVPAGKITVYLPDDAAARDTITGMVVAEPAGTNQAERERNEDVLSGYVVETPISTPRQSGAHRIWSLPGMTQFTGLRFLLKGPDGRQAAEATARIEPPRGAKPNAIQIPGLAVVGRPAEISGPFDGDVTNTTLKVGPMNLRPMVESPGKVAFATPTLLGQTNVTCTEGKMTAEAPVQLVSFNIQVEDPVIRVGQATNANVRIGGLSGGAVNKSPLTCLVVNHNPQIVTLEGGDLVPLTISPTEIGSDGTYRKRMRITAKSVGLYSISLKPSNPGSTLTSTSPEVPGEEDEQSPPFDVRLGNLPKKLTGNRPVRLSVTSLTGVPIQAATFAVKREPNGSWETVGTDSDPAGGFTAEWDRSDMSGGTYMVSVTASGGDGQTGTDCTTLVMEDPNGLPAGTMEFGNRNFQRDFTNAAATIVTISSGDISRGRNRASGLRDQADRKRDEAAKQDETAQSEWEKAYRKSRQAQALIELDEKIEGTLAGVAKEIEELIKRIEELKGALGGQPNEAAIDKAVADLEQAVIDCDKECEKKKKELEDAEKKVDDIEKEMEDIAKEINDLFQADGWTGNARFDRGAGIVRWGFVRDGGGGSNINTWGTPQNQRVNELRRRKNQLKKDLKKAKEDVERAKDALKECMEECEKKKKALEDAKKAKEQKDEAKANEAKIDERAAELDKTLAELESYLERNPDLPKDLLDRLKKLREQLPIDSADWEKFKKDLEDLIKRKQQIEEDLKRQAEDHQEKGNDASGKADDLRGEANGLDDEAWREDKAASDLEAEKKRQEAAAAEEAKRRAKEREAAAAAQHEKCLEEFRKWIQDNIDREILPEDALEQFENWLNEHASKIPDLIDAIGKVASGAASSKAGAGASGVAQGIVSLGAAIFYWWMEAELKGACDRLAKKIDEVTKQRIILELAEQRPPKPCGVLHPMRDQSQSWFYFRKGNKVLLFKISRRGGLECMGEVAVR